MKKPATAGPIKIVINQSKGVVTQVVSKSDSSKKEGHEQPAQPSRSLMAQRSSSTESQSPVPLEPQVLLEEGGRAVAQWKKQESNKVVRSEKYRILVQGCHK